MHSTKAKHFNSHNLRWCEAKLSYIFCDCCNDVEKSPGEIVECTTVALRVKLLKHCWVRCIYSFYWFNFVNLNQTIPKIRCNIMLIFSKSSSFRYGTLWLCLDSDNFECFFFISFFAECTIKHFEKLLTEEKEWDREQLNKRKTKKNKKNNTNTHIYIYTCTQEMRKTFLVMNLLRAILFTTFANMHFVDTFSCSYYQREEAA